MKNRNRRNFGWGKQPRYAIARALAGAYGVGHYGTQDAYRERCKRFVAYLRYEHAIRDLRDVRREHVVAYAHELAKFVEDEALSRQTAKNYLSAVNMAFRALRADDALAVAPVDYLGRCQYVRVEAPAGLEQVRVDALASRMYEQSEPGVAVMIRLARAFGLRAREAALLNVSAALSQAEAREQIDIRRGTKGGRGRKVERWVPASNRAIGILRAASHCASDRHCLIPSTMNWVQFYQYAYGTSANVARELGLATGFHDLRAAWACERYAALTGAPAPVVGGKRDVPQAIDRAARDQLAYELGHGRRAVVSAYVGSAK